MDITCNTTENMLGTDSTNADFSHIKNESEDKINTKPTYRIRICLVGSVIDDQSTIETAKSFGVPIVTSETGTEFIEDSLWTTYFIMNDFHSPVFDAIHKSKHKILGPPAFQQALQTQTSLENINRPIYSYAMKGVITCFTGIRKKDELTRLVHLIHSMGGSIRKDMNSKVTHLICNSSGGDKYQYAMTFRLSVVKPSWVYEAWEKRHDVSFCATNEIFALTHKLKAFEGQRICFLGFPPEDKQHMVDVLITNGGINCDIDDPECSHVIISNTVARFPEILCSSPDPPVSNDQQCSNELNDKKRTDFTVRRVIDFDKDSSNEENSEQENLEKRNLNVQNCTSTHCDENSIFDLCSTPSRKDGFGNSDDGIVLHANEENQFINPNNISPILYSNEINNIGLNKIPEEEDELVKKRKRDSFEDISITSTESFAPNFSSAKKPKLRRTGSITRTLRRSLSFVSMKTPVSNLFRFRRNSVDPNASYSSVISTESTFNEQLMENLHGIKEQISKKFRKSDKNSSKIFNQQSNVDRFNEQENSNFKTPKAPDATPKTSYSIYDKVVKTKEVEVGSPLGRTSVKLCKDYPSDITKTTAVQDNEISAHRTILPIVDEQPVQTVPELNNNKTHILKAEWFWYTIQNGFATESDYKFEDYLNSIANTPSRRDSHPSLNKRKRKRLSQRLGFADGVSIVPGKRRSSVSDAGLLSMSGSFLDCTGSPDTQESRNKHHPVEEIIKEEKSKNRSMRYNHFMDFFHTESNYVGILDTILTFFKIPLEEKADANENEALLNKSEIKAIFSNFLPIHHVHKKMLNSLRELKGSWLEDCLIGQIILDNRNDLIKAYPPYVNFFEQMKEVLLQCDKEKPRFHAFLKINQSKPECGRQSLQDLMIRPVQRLPSISLLLNDILKHTTKNNPDYKKLDDALKAIKEVMTYINEDKRKTEGQLAMFDIFNDIDNCPPHLVSSHRSFILKCEVTELSDSLSGRGDHLMLFLFNDTLEVCKKRTRSFNTVKSPSTTINSLNNMRVTTTKPYKHIKLMSLNTIRIVYDIRDSSRSFAIGCRFNQDIKEKLYSFNIYDEEIDKIIFLKCFCKQLAENACRTDTDNFMTAVESQEIDVDISEVNLGTLSKAFKFATRTRLKVGRAFSFSKTPSKLKRAVSTMTTSPFGSTNSIQAASQLANMKLGSCTNISEIHEEENGDSPTSTDILIAPLTVQPTRKAKASTLSNLRHL